MKTRKLVFRRSLSGRLRFRQEIYGDWSKTSNLATGVSMNSKRSYLDALNAGRQRRPYASLEQLNRSLETLEQRIERNREEVADYSRASLRRAPSQPYGQGFEGGTRASARPRAPEYRGAYDQPYQSIARDIERVRSQEDGVAAFGKIAGEIKGLREELRHQMTSGVRREFESLRKDIEHAYATGSGKAVGKLGLDVERLSEAVQSLAEKSDDRSVNMLRLEIEQMKGALDTLAREETVLSVDRRWEDFDRRFNDFEHRVSADARQKPSDPDLAAVIKRLEQISEAVGNLPESLSLRSLEDKVRTLAGALDHFIEQQGGRTTETFGLIEERLDEISRAIVGATVAAQTQHFNPEPFERIEARISALARQIEEVAEDRPTGEVIERLNLLSERVDDMAARHAMPDEAVERLAHQIAVIADKIDRAPPILDANEIFAGIEQRFDVLSGLIERRQGDALEQGNMLFRELERRLEEVADRIDQRQTDAALDSTSIMGAIDARFSALAQRLETGKPDDDANSAIRGLETRLDGISKRLDQSATQFAGIDPELVRNLESQVAGLSAHLARPSAPLPDFEDIGAPARGTREVDRRKPRNGSGSRPPRGGKRCPLACRQPGGICRGLRPRAGPQGAGDADAALGRAQQQDLRGDPRHASEDRRPARFAGTRNGGGHHKSGPPGAPGFPGAENGTQGCAVDRRRADIPARRPGRRYRFRRDHPVAKNQRRTFAGASRRRRRHRGARFRSSDRG